MANPTHIPIQNDAAALRFLIAEIHAGFRETDDNGIRKSKEEMLEKYAPQLRRALARLRRKKLKE